MRERRTSVGFDPDVFDAVAEAARRDERSISQWISRAARDRLASEAPDLLPAPFAEAARTPARRRSRSDELGARGVA